MKLSPKYYGPYKVIAKIGAVAYRLELPKEAKVHPTFHVSQLKGYNGNVPATSLVMPNLVQASTMEGLVPEFILAYQIVAKNGRPGVDVLIKWCGRGLEDATWMASDKLKQEFPEFVSQNP